LSAPVSVRF